MSGSAVQLEGVFVVSRPPSFNLIMFALDPISIIFRVAALLNRLYRTPRRDFPPRFTAACSGKKAQCWRITAATNNIHRHICVHSLVNALYKQRACECPLTICLLCGIATFFFFVAAIFCFVLRMVFSSHLLARYYSYLVLVCMVKFINVY